MFRRTVFIAILATRVPLGIAAPSDFSERAVITASGGDTVRRLLPGIRNGIFETRNEPLSALLSFAYGLLPNRIIGPEWLQTAKFDIHATASQSTTDDDLRRLVQGLLSDRFGLVLHREKRSMATYDMRVAEGGVKLYPFDPVNKPPAMPNLGGVFWDGIAPTYQIADLLASFIGRPVIDQTGVEGRFYYALNFTSPAMHPDKSSVPPDIVTAAEKQLGFNLEPNVEPVEVLVIDAILPTPKT